MGKPSKSAIYTKNEFLGTLVEKIGRQTYSSRAYLNPLAKFKKGFMQVFFEGNMMDDLNSYHKFRFN